MSARKSSYTPIPALPPELMPRLAAIVEVLAGIKTVSQAARDLELSRNHFQSILHRALFAMIDSLTLKPGGRPAKGTELTALQVQLQRLERQNVRLQRQVDSTEELLTMAGSLLRGRIRPTGRQRRARKSSAAKEAQHDEGDPEAGRRSTLEAAEHLHRLGARFALAATLAGVDVSTLRRWRGRAQQCLSLARAGRGAVMLRLPAPASAERLVRRLHGLIGAEALRHSVTGLSRRAAAWVKAQTLTAMERERKGALMRITLTQPGVLRAVDAMHFSSADGALYALIAADGAVPYRTSLHTGTHYDAQLVARTLRRDFEQHGAPLVLRLDRASAHGAPAVRDLLDAYEVLPLHGPPRYPCFYGQLERQNREHRAWCASLPRQPRAQLEPCLTEMLEAVNTLWPRRTLAWRTASEVWNARPQLVLDRVAFREEVRDRAVHIAHRLKRRPQPADLAERLAIEQTLERLGYLRRQPGGWC